jgi:hypothetical protein
MGAESMAKVDYIGLGGDALLAKAFADWSFMGFDFPKVGIADGCIGEKCISKAVQYYLRRKTANNTWQAAPDDTVGLLSGHLYFKASCGDVKDSTRTFNVALKEFHLTMRRSKSQLLIDDSGPSILTSDESIHINRNTEWGRKKNLQNLVVKLASEIQAGTPFTEVEVIDFLTGYKRLTQERLGLIADELLVDARAHLEKQLGVPVTVTGDATFTGRQ